MFRKKRRKKNSGGKGLTKIISGLLKLAPIKYPAFVRYLKVSKKTLILKDIFSVFFETPSVFLKPLGE